MEHRPIQGTERARERSRLGLTRESQQTRVEQTKKPTSGSKGAALFLREECVEYALLYSVDATPEKIWLLTIQHL